MIERTGLLKFAGQDVTIVGSDLQVGEKAPEFTAQAQDWSEIKGLRSTKGKVRIIGSLPSLSTSVCDRETRRFNQEAAALGEDVAILTVSMDLPYTLKNWCAAAGIDQVTTLSDHQSADFGKKYGVLVKEKRIFRRAVFVVDRKGILTYTAYMPALGEEPNYAEVLEAARKALQG
ncbi:MAG TPA: thiol peroxidase [Anaerolineales bacterium]|nr:thiol peroxidase [Anaerolineales bacterium]